MEVTVENGWNVLRQWAEDAKRGDFAVMAISDSGRADDGPVLSCAVLPDGAVELKWTPTYVPIDTRLLSHTFNPEEWRVVAEARRITLTPVQGPVIMFGYPRTEVRAFRWR